MRHARAKPGAHDFTLASYLDADHLIVGTPAVSELLVKKALGSQASRRRAGLYVPHYTVAPFVISDTDLIAVLFWHARSNHAPGCQRLRRVIAQLFAGSGTKSRAGSQP
jgi:hypothetical protein